MLSQFLLSLLPLCQGFLRRFFSAWWAQPCHYINGPDTLPPPLTKEEEAQVMENIRNGVPGAREPLITHNLRLVVYIAKKFESPGASVEDLISIGTIGLIKAVNTFRIEKNIKLATYASRCIENEILMHLRKSSQLRNEISIDDPLNVDWDGNELLLSDLLGSDPDAVNQDIEQAAKRGGPPFPPGKNHYAAALRAGFHQGTHPKRGGRPAGHFPVLHIPAGKADYHPAAQGSGEGQLILSVNGKCFSTVSGLCSRLDRPLPPKSAPVEKGAAPHERQGSAG